MYEVDGARITEKGGIDERLLGGNASAEGGDEGADDGEVTGIDIVLAHKLQPTPFDKKSFTVYIKGYMAEYVSNFYKVLNRKFLFNPSPI